MTPLRLWVCPEGHAFQAREDDEPTSVWSPVCKRCTPPGKGEARPLMVLREYVPVTSELVAAARSDARHRAAIRRQLRESVTPVERDPHMPACYRGGI